jgi:hypothetical protein
MACSAAGVLTSLLFRQEMMAKTLLRRRIRGKEGRTIIGQKYCSIPRPKNFQGSLISGKPLRCSQIECKIGIELPNSAHISMNQFHSQVSSDYDCKCERNV